MKDIEMPQVEEPGFECASCLKQVVDYNDILFIENCSHIVCKACLEPLIERLYPDVSCPSRNCDVMLNDLEVKAVLGDKRYDELQSGLVNKLLAKQSNIIMCKCGNAIEFLKGKPNYDLKNE